MQHFLNQTFLDNTVKSYLIVAAIVLLLFICRRYVSKYFAGILYKLFAKKGKAVLKNAFVNLIIPPLELFLLIFVAFIALDKLRFPSVLDFDIYHITFKHIIDGTANAVLIIVFIWLCLRVIDFIAMILGEKTNQTKDITDNQLIVFFKDFFKVILVIIGILLIIQFSFHKSVGNLLTGLSIVGAAVALATRESLENLIASFIIFFDKPFYTGDVVKVHSFTGTVEKIGLRSTRIRTEAKTFLSVPNKQMVDSLIDNISLRTERRVDIQLEVSIKTTAAQLKAASEAIKNMLMDNVAIKLSQVYVSDTGKNAHIITIHYFTVMPQEITEFYVLREEININIIALFASMHINFAASQINVVVNNM